VLPQISTQGIYTPNDNTSNHLPPMNILVLNAGSSSQKISLFKNLDKIPDAPAKPTWETKLESNINIGSIGSSQIDKKAWLALLNQTLTPLWSGPNKILGSAKEIDAVGHRVVHGGKKYLRSTLVDETVERDIESFAQLAPLHNEINLAGIFAISQLLPPGVKQVAVFDTAFHRTIPEIASLYPVPYEWSQQFDLCKFGFHGINYQYCTQRAAQMLGKTISVPHMIICHLGAGASLAAIEGGQSIDTTMGFTPMDGLMMASRCGAIDPGILIYLLKNNHMSVSELDNVLNKHSGLMGISGSSTDMSVIIAQMNNGDLRAKLAFDMYIYRLAQKICEMRAALKHFDTLVFTAGIGENSSLVRESVCRAIDFLGVRLNDKLNQSTTSDGFIESSESKVKVLVINAREGWQIAKECWHLLHDRL
jgi:acetate kinase